MLRAAGLTRRFGDLLAVDDVSFDVPPGQLTGFIGGNGAGKTTTMRMVMGVLSTNGGVVEWDGRPATAADRRSFGYMPEERGLYPKQKIAGQLGYLGQLKGLSPATAATQVGELLDRFGLADRAKQTVEKLSLGNQQRVQIIAALLGEPRALILDEPFSGLDPSAVDSMVSVLREQTSRGVPVLFSSHQLDLVDRLVDGLVIMSRGRVVAAGTVAQLRSVDAGRVRLVVEADPGWLRTHRGVTDLVLDGATATFTVTEPGADQHVLAEALTRGPVRSFGPFVRPLADIYREVTA